jgi:signal transduction histidine kinase
VLLAKTLRSSTLKLALACIGIFGAVVFALFAYVYWSTVSHVRSRADHAVAAEYSILRAAFDAAGRGGLIASIEQHIAEQRLAGGYYLLAEPSFAPVAGNLAVWPSGLNGPGGWEDVGVQERKAEAQTHVLLRARFDTLPDGYHLLVGTDIGDLSQFAGKIQAALAGGILLLLVLAGVATASVTRRTVGRIEAINATSRAIMHDGLGKRIPVRGTRDEWDQLAENLNLMLDRIEALMGEVKQVTDNVAHDLRTPLARIRGRLEKALGRPEAPHDQALISDVIADLDAVLRIFSSLTRISQIEARDRTAAFRAVNLAEIASEVVELFDAAAEDKGSHLTVAGDGDVPVTGDRDLLFDALSNLVDNAITHGPKGTRIVVAVAQSDSGPVISVADNGPGIPPHEFQNVLKRFYRLERSRSTPGNGLGLSLVAAIARLHGAVVEMVDNAPGLQIRLAFRRSPVSRLQDASA